MLQTSHPPPFISLFPLSNTRKIDNVTLEDGCNLVRLSKYGGTRIQERYLTRGCTGRQMFLMNGVIVTKELVQYLAKNNPYHNIENNAYSNTIKNIESAMMNYYAEKRQKRLRNILWCFVMFHTHYMNTMETSYRPDGPGYQRIYNSTLIGNKI